jgi:hypothetical protein
MNDESKNNFAVSLRWWMTASVLHLVIVLPLAWMLNLWLDEAWAMQTTAGGLSLAWHEAIYSERQAPFYFLLLAIWRGFDDTVFFARLFSIVCTVLSIFVFGKLLERFLPVQNRNKSFVPKFLLIGFALHPTLIWAALEIRVYALVILLSGLLLWCWFDGYVEKEDRRKQFFYVILAVISLYTNYYLGFLLFANACALVPSKRWRALFHYLWQMAIVAVCIVPLVWIIKQQFGLNTEYYRETPTLLAGVKFIFGHVTYFILPSDWEALAFFRIWLVRISLIILVFVIVKNKARDLDWKTVSLAVVTAVVSFFLLLAYFLLGEEYIGLRHACLLFIPTILFFVTILSGYLPRRGWLALGLVLAFFYAASFYAVYAPQAKRGDWARVAAYLKANEQPNQPIAVYRIYDTIPLDFYYDGINQIVPQNVTHDWGYEDAPGTVTRYKRQIDYLISQIPPENETFWLITEYTCDAAETAIECQPLEDFVATNYVVESSQNFYLRKARLLRRKTR